jgi:limonene-1,2-epoxide hydrolase
MSAMLAQVPNLSAFLHTQAAPAISAWHTEDIANRAAGFSTEHGPANTRMLDRSASF